MRLASCKSVRNGATGCPQQKFFVGVRRRQYKIAHIPSGCPVIRGCKSGASK